MKQIYVTRVWGHGIVLVMRMGNKDIVEDVLFIENSEGKKRFRCEKMAKVPDFDMLSEWENRSELIWTYQRKCTSLNEMATRLAEEPACRGWKVLVDATTKPYSSIYADHQVVALIEDLQKNKKPMPAGDLLVGRGRNATKVVNEYYRINKGAKERKEREAKGETVQNDW
jgi:hypothetical protein